MRKINGVTLSNDGEVAIVRMSDGDRVKFIRTDPAVEKVQSKERFLRDFKPGEVTPSFERTRL